MVAYYKLAHPYEAIYGVEFAWQRRQHFLDLGRLGPPRGKLLDVGCSFGLLLEEAQKLGWDVYGLEADADAATAAAARLGADRVQQGWATDLPVGEFAAITMSHVFEHLTDFRTVLSNVRDRLEPGGVLAVQSPNRRTLWNLTHGEDHRPLEHPFYWTHRALAAELRRAGLAPRIAPPAFRLARNPSELLKATALGLERLSSRVNWGIKSTLEIQGVKDASITA